MLSVDDVRLLLNLSKEDISDETLQRYIDYFAKEIAAKLHVPLDDIKDSPLFDQALLCAIACHLSKVDPDLFTAGAGKTYQVGDTKLETVDKYFTQLPNWCDAYEEAMNDLIVRSISNVQPFRRKGLSNHAGWHHYVF